MSKDGGPAFPGEVDHGQSGREAWCGMSLRDYFAAKAMHAELLTCGVPGEACADMVKEAKRLNRDPLYHMACNAYDAADAMLKARQQ